MGKTVSIMRIIRITRIVTRIEKLRNLCYALAGAFSGVLWILVLVLVTTYGYAIVGVMLFNPTDVNDPAIKPDADCDAECVVDNMDAYFGTLFSYVFICE